MKKLLFISLSIIFALNASGINIQVKGKIFCQGKALSSVQVTDGKTIVTTDRNGKYCLQTTSEKEYVYYTLPSGYESPIENGIPVFYKKINPELKKQSINFELNKATKSQTNLCK